MHRTPTTVLSAAIIAMAAFGLSGCGQEPIPPVPEPATTSTEVGPPAGPTGQAPLPGPEALIDVLVRLADPAVPGEQKVGLVELATPADAASLDRFAKAVVDGGMAPLSFQATDLTWSATDPGDVVATITVTPANPAPESKPFTFPMQFTRSGEAPDAAWQLTRVTADQLLELGPVPPPAESPEPPR